MNSRDKVEQHLIQQKGRSVDSDNSACMYRGADGRMCAAGCLIPDELYHPALERRAISLLVADGKMDIFPTDITAAELKKWQGYHDGAVNLEGNFDIYWCYRDWISGDENHHPSLFKEALAAAMDVEECPA